MRQSNGLYSIHEESSFVAIAVPRTTNVFSLAQILVLIDDEEFRSRKFLSPTSYKKVYNECLQRLVCDHFDTLKSECPNLIVQEDLDGERNDETMKRNSSPSFSFA